MGVLGKCYFYSQIISLYFLHIGLYDRSKAVMQLLFENNNRASKILEVKHTSFWMRLLLALLNKHLPQEPVQTQREVTVYVNPITALRLQ